jgi:transcriptional regulator with XRE-family HTH domain
MAESYNDKRKDGPVELKSTQEIGSEIARLRESSGISQEKLGEILGVDQPTISNIERGVRKPSLREIAIVADTFSTSIESLVSQETSAFAMRTSDCDDEDLTAALAICNRVIEDFLVFELAAEG